MSDAPTLLGIGRDKDNNRALVLYLSTEPSDDVMRDIHQVLTTNREVVGYQVRSNRKSMPDAPDDWGDWRYTDSDNLVTWKNRADRMPNVVQIRGLIVKT